MPVSSVSNTSPASVLTPTTRLLKALDVRIVYFVAGFFAGALCVLAALALRSWWKAIPQPAAPASASAQPSPRPAQPSSSQPPTAANTAALAAPSAPPTQPMTVTTSRTAATAAADLAATAAPVSPVTKPAEITEQQMNSAIEALKMGFIQSGNSVQAGFQLVLDWSKQGVGSPAGENTFAILAIDIDSKFRIVNEEIVYNGKIFNKCDSFTGLENSLVKAISWTEMEKELRIWLNKFAGQPKKFIVYAQSSRGGAKHAKIVTFDFSSAPAPK